MATLAALSKPVFRSLLYAVLGPSTVTLSLFDHVSFMFHQVRRRLAGFSFQCGTSTDSRGLGTLWKRLGLGFGFFKMTKE